MKVNRTIKLENCWFFIVLGINIYIDIYFFIDFLLLILYFFL